MKLTAEKNHLTDQNFAHGNTDCVVVAVYEDGELSDNAQTLEKRDQPLLMAMHQSRQLSGKVGDSVLIYQADGLPHILAVGFGEKDSVTPIAIIGRPNAGKSTLVNALLKEDRLVTSSVPGTTRDSVRIPFEYNNHKFVLIDTAGVRRKSRVREAIEKYSIVQTLDAISSAHVVICMVDVTEGLADQDATLLEIAIREGRALVFALNKTDSATHDDYHQLQYTLDTRYQYLSYVDKIKISAEKKVGLKKLMQAVVQANKSAAIDLSTSEANQLLQQAVEANVPPLVKGRRIKLRYTHQGGSHPPTFVLYGSQTSKLPKSYMRYLENFFRSKLKIVGTPIRFLLRSPDNPFAGKKNVLTPRQQRKRERMMAHYKKK